MSGFGRYGFEDGVDWNRYEVSAMEWGEYNGKVGKWDGSEHAWENGNTKMVWASENGEAEIIGYSFTRYTESLRLSADVLLR